MAELSRAPGDRAVEWRIAIMLVALNLFVSNALTAAETIGTLPIQFPLLRLVLSAVVSYYLVQGARWAHVLAVVYFGWVTVAWFLVYQAGGFSGLPAFFKFIDPALSIPSLFLTLLSLIKLKPRAGSDGSN